MIDTRNMIDRLFYSSVGQLIISSLFGLSLALLFNRVCKENCILYFAPKYDDIDNKIFKLEDTCYKYRMVNVSCNKNPVGAYDGTIKPSNQIEEKSFFDKVFA